MYDHDTEDRLYHPGERAVYALSSLEKKRLFSSTNRGKKRKNREKRKKSAVFAAGRPSCHGRRGEGGSRGVHQETLTTLKREEGDGGESRAKKASPASARTTGGKKKAVHKGSSDIAPRRASGKGGGVSDNRSGSP